MFVPSKIWIGIQIWILKHLGSGSRFFESGSETQIAIYCSYSIASNRPPQKRKKVKKFRVLKCKMFSLVGWRLLLWLYGGLRIKIQQFLMEKLIFSTVKVMNVFSTKNLDRDPDPDFKKAWDPGPDSLNPKHRSLYNVLIL